jgi:colanic acid/amylovoran biosynthesis glycosyltransferase
MTKVLFLIPAFPVASETFIEREIRELYRRDKIKVQVVSFHKAAEFNFAELSEITHYVKLQLGDIARGELFFLVKNPKVLMNTLALVLQTSPNVIANMYLWLKSVGYAYKLRDYDFDQLHAHFFSQPSTIGLVIAMLLNKKFSVSGHAKDVFDTAKSSDSKPQLIKQKMRYARFAVLCNYKAMLACQSKTDISDTNKVHLLYHGVDLSAQIAEDVSPSESRLYFVGRFVQKKGLIYLLEAAKIIKEHIVKFRLFIAGYGPDYAFLKNFVLSNDLIKEVEFVNDNRGIDNATSLNYMNHASIVVVPAIDIDSGDSDGIPNVILEAGMLRKPVITTDAGSITEIVKSGYNALVVQQKNEQELAAAIMQLLADPKMQRSLGQNLRQVVESKFDLAKNITRLEDLFVI